MPVTPSVIMLRVSVLSGEQLPVLSGEQLSVLCGEQASVLSGEQLFVGSFFLVASQPAAMTETGKYKKEPMGTLEKIFSYNLSRNYSAIGQVPQHK